MEASRPSTPPPAVSTSSGGVAAGKTSLSPEQLRRIEANRQKAKALFEERQRTLRSHSTSTANNTTTPSLTSGQKRSHTEISGSNSTSPLNNPRASASLRDARNKPPTSPSPASAPAPLRPVSRKMASYVEYDFSKMTDTKGGFLSTTDDPLSAVDTTGKPDNMSIKAWSEHLLRQKLIASKQGVFEPHLSALNKGTKEGEKQAKCFECGSWELDWTFLEVFRCRVCHRCKEKFPEKYSLLTKTECKEDYLITDPELKDDAILPHLSRPNPHKATWNDMQLFLRYQVEERAKVKWGSLEKLDEEYERRSGDKRKKKDEKFRKKLLELKNRTRVETWKRAAEKSGGTGVRKGAKHEHVWGVPVDGKEPGTVVRTCAECGFEVEEVVL